MVYKAMEDSSMARAEQAAEATGASVSDMDAMKITDMKDNMRAGDIAAVTRTPNVGGMTFSVGNPLPAGSGGYGIAGVQGVTSLHQQTAAQRIRAGQMN
jgi:hypothetical protein